MNYSGYFQDIDGNKYYPNSRMRFKGMRNRYYLIGTQVHNGKDSSSAGQLTMFISNTDYYDSGIAGFANVDKSGKVVVATIVPWSLSSYKKILYVYTDNNKDYIFLYSPNYNDNWFIEILVSANVTISWQGYTKEEFENLISGKTLISKSA